MILKILSCQRKPFKNSEGQEMEYFWLKAEKVDGVVIQVGTPKNYSDMIGQSVEIPVEKREFSNGKVGYKEAII